MCLVGVRRNVRIVLVNSSPAETHVNDALVPEE